MENNGTTAPVQEQIPTQIETVDTAADTTEISNDPIGNAEEQVQAEEANVNTSSEKTVEKTNEQPAAETAEQAESQNAALKEETEGQDTPKDLSRMTKEELIDYLAEAISSKGMAQLRQIVDQTKTAFYKLHNIEQKAKEQAGEIKEQAGEIIENVEDSLESRFKELLAAYRAKRDQFVANSEHEKEKNYKAKLAIIEELKKLTESNETDHNTFAAFRELQGKWKEIGQVPQNVVNDLWENYNHYTEIFYNSVKMYKEMRDFDLKKNLETKTSLCERAEQLYEDPSAVSAFHSLQELHDEWRETGPVAAEFKDALWERFKEASSRINKRHQEYFEKIKEEQLENLRLKAELCERVENISLDGLSTHKDWDEASSKILEIQKIWKTIGFTPKKENTAIYERFRAACDKFFAAKHEFVNGIKKELDNNLQSKLKLCQIAEDIVANISESTEWKKATDELLELQKQWKNIGPTARKHSEASWLRFRGACDKFFEKKSEFFKEAENEFTKHLEEKKQLLAELKETAKENITFDYLKQIQERWASIGFVPIKEKESIQKQFKETMDSLYKVLKGSEAERRVEGFKKKIASIRQSGSDKINSEHERLVQKMHQLESQITTLENNVGFFGHSKNAEALIKDVEAKIQNAKSELKEIIGKIKIIENGEE